MTSGYIIGIIFFYFSLLFIIAKVTGKNATSSTFFIANRNAPWFLVAYGMVGVAISGITFISVPGQVFENAFSYFQMVMGFSIGLIIVAYILIPLFYRSNVISIYSYLKQRFGTFTHKTGAVFFLFAQLATASFKLFLMAHVLQIFLFNRLGVSFEITVMITLMLIWLYTYKGGIKTVIITDTFQTTFLILAVILSLISISRQLNLSAFQMVEELNQMHVSKIFFWEWDHPHNFFKLLFAGVFLTVMTNGLDQSVMQKHLTCKNLKDSQKNIITLAVIILGVNFLFLFLGGALKLYSSNIGISLSDQTDDIFPQLALNNLGIIAGTFFLVGILAAAYSSADSSLTGLTTSFCLDILNIDFSSTKNIKIRYLVHFGFTLLIFITIILFNTINNQSVLTSFIKTSGYIYGPLLALFAIGIFTNREINDHAVPWICVLAPLLSILIDIKSKDWLDGFEFGYGILVLNSIIALTGFFIISKDPKPEIV